MEDNAENLFKNNVVDPKAKYSGTDIFVHELSEISYKTNSIDKPHESVIKFNNSWRNDNGLYPIHSQGGRDVNIKAPTEYHKYMLLGGDDAKYKPQPRKIN